MRQILGVGGLALLITLIVTAGEPLAGTFAEVSGRGQSAAAVYYYDEFGALEYVDISPSEYFFDGPAYGSDAYLADRYFSGLYGGEAGYSDESSYDYVSTDYVYDYAPAPTPWYLQSYGGIGYVAQTLVQGLAPQTVAQRPSCAITASPANVAYGGSAVLQWRSAGATWAELTGLGPVDSSGSWQFDYFTRSRTFTLSVSGPGGTASCGATVLVAQR